MDERLIGLWSDRALYPSDVESAELAFRADGSGWLYWSSWSSAFTVSRYTWKVPRQGSLAMTFHHTLDGTWSIDDGITRHDVEAEEPDETLVEIGYGIVPGEDPLGYPVTLLSLDRPLDDHLAGSRFAWVQAPETFSDPAADGPRPDSPSLH